MQQIFNIDLNIFEKEITLGNGSYGIVYLVHKKQDKTKLFAAKEMISKINESLLIKLINEIKIIALINHPSVIRFVGFNKLNFAGEEKPIIITPYCSKGSLEDYVKSAHKKKLNDTQKLIILYGIASAMKFLHEHDPQILHRDLKPVNILLDDDLYPKICDFGISRFFQDEEDSNWEGTPLYMAPEIIKDKKYTEKGDVYAFAIITYELMFNETPFDVKKRRVLFTKVINGERPIIEDQIASFYKNLIEKCWSQNPENRPSFSDILNELRNDPGFITSKIDESKYYDYIFLLDQTPHSFNEIPDFEIKDFENFDPEDMIKYAQCKEDEGDFEEARRCYKLAGDFPTDNERLSGLVNTNGMLNYARCCQSGIGGEININEYVEYIKKAAESNNGDAQYRYGLILEKGEYVEQNLKRAALFYKYSADLSNQNALVKYINCLANGIGVRKNVYQALRYCQKLIYNRQKSALYIKEDKNSKENIIYNEILSHLTDDDYIEDDIEVNEINNNDIILEKVNINWENEIIKFKGREYNYNYVNLICGKESLNENLNKLMNHKYNFYPQGFDYCKNLLARQMENNGTVLNFNNSYNKKWTCFYFSIIYDEGYHIYLGSDIIAEIDRIDKRKDKDIYPQGENYCIKLLQELGYARILSKKISKSNRVFYYFRSYYEGKFPKNKNNWEEVYFIQGGNDIDKELNDMEEKRKNTKCSFYPRNSLQIGKELSEMEKFNECKRILQNAKKNNDFVIILENGVYNEENVYRYFPSKAIFTTLFEEEWIIKGERNLNNELKKINDNDTNEKIKGHVITFPQGKENCTSLITEQIENGGKVHVLKRKSNYSSCFWFYFKVQT